MQASPEQVAIFSRFADSLTEKVCETIRQMPGITQDQIIALESTVASQLVNGRRGVYRQVLESGEPQEGVEGLS